MSNIYLAIIVLCKNNLSFLPGAPFLTVIKKNEKKSLHSHYFSRSATPSPYMIGGLWIVKEADFFFFLTASASPGLKWNQWQGALLGKGTSKNTPGSNRVCVCVRRLCDSGNISACQCRRCRRCGLDPWVGRSPGGGNGSPLRDSCLESPMDRGAWGATVHGVAKSWTRLSDWAHKLPSGWYNQSRWVMSHRGCLFLVNPNINIPTGLSGMCSRTVLTRKTDFTRLSVPNRYVIMSRKSIFRKFTATVIH